MKVKSLLVTLMMTTAITSQAADIVVSGTVTDSSDGEPLIGATVQVKGKAGVATDFDGKYKITVDEHATLQFSYIGYRTEDVKVNGRTTINVAMENQEQMLDQVVVIGYGTQKKVNLTGSVASINVGEDITSRSAPNVSSVLSGLMPGLSVTQSTGMAGNNSAELMIRGMGTINDASPLIVVDDMPDVDINRLNINDIESISVLKDATASSVYGSRAANGVILIKTKSGSKDKPTQISFSGSFGWQDATKAYDLLNDYAKVMHLSQMRSLTDPGLNGPQQNYKEGTIDQWLALGMIDEVRYPNTDWFDYVMRTGTIQNYNVAAQGGGEKASFFASVGYMKQKGLQINNDYDRFNARMNFDYYIHPKLRMGMRMDGSWSNYSYAQSNGFNGEDNRIANAVSGIYPYDPATGHYGGPMAYGELAEAFNPLCLYENSVKKENRQELNGQAYLEWNAFKGFTARIDYSLRYYNQYYKDAPTPVRSYDFQRDEYRELWYIQPSVGVTDRNVNGYKTLWNLRLNYDRVFANIHDLKLMAIYSEEFWFSRSNTTARMNVIHPSLSEVNAALTTQQTTGGTSSRTGLRSFIGRAGYILMNRYLAEFNFRVDGSSKFLRGHQYGFFPSGSIGWRISQEPWFESLASTWLNNLKIRASYGGLGNNSGIGAYQQREIMTQNNYMFDGAIATGFVYQKMLNRALTWEKTNVFNLGLDLGLFNSRLTAELDYYDRLTTGMLQNSQMSIHLTGGYEAPKANLGNLRNRGFEVNLTWRDRVADFTYSVNGNVSYNKMNLEKWGEFLDKGNIFLNMPYQFVYYMPANPYLAQTWQEIYGYVDQGAAPGDIIRLDANGDGVLDGNDKIANPNRLRNAPTTNFALKADAQWRGFDFSMLWQGGAGRSDIWITKYNATIFSVNGYTPTVEHLLNPWSWENRGGAWSRLGGNATNATENFFHLRNMDYFRLKNIQIGYTVPKKITTKFFVQNLRVYFSADNVVTLTKYEGLDPEKPAGSGDLYPTTRTYTVGLNLSF